MISWLCPASEPTYLYPDLMYIYNYIQTTCKELAGTAQSLELNIGVWYLKCNVLVISNLSLQRKNSLNSHCMLQKIQTSVIPFVFICVGLGWVFFLLGWWLSLVQADL